jgi:SPP1 family predicted phage head-tail adaptor
MIVDRLNHRIKIYKQGTTTNKLNEFVSDSILVTELWAAVEPLQGKEYFAAFAEQADITTRIRIRYRSGIDRTMWAVHNGIRYDIKYIIHPKLARKELQLMCKDQQ